MSTATISPPATRPLPQGPRRARSLTSTTTHPSFSPSLPSPDSFPPPILPSFSITSEQFLDWLEPGVHADLIAGEIFMHSPVSLDHADHLNFLDGLMRQYIDEFRLGALHREQVAVRLGPRDTFLPDLAYYTPEQVKRFGRTHVAFAPTLVVEALSPTSIARDRGAKFAAYESHGVQEYWIIDPIAADHRFYRRNATTALLEEFATQNSPLIESRALPGFWLKREWLAAPAHFPPFAPCLAELRATHHHSTTPPPTTTHHHSHHSHHSH